MASEVEEVETITLDAQFLKYVVMLEPRQSVTLRCTINLYRLDFWLRQARILDDRDITMTDTGILFFKFNKSEINYEEFIEFLKDLSELKQLNLKEVESALCSCGLPGEHRVMVPQYRDYFLTWKPKNRLINKEHCEDLKYIKITEKGKAPPKSV